MKIDIASTWMPKDLSTSDILSRIYDLAEEFYPFKMVTVSVEPGTYRCLCSQYDGYICHTVMHPLPGCYNRVCDLEDAIERYKTEVTHIFAEEYKDVVRLDEPCLDEWE